MQKLPVGQAAEILGITKEAVYNRIRRGSLKAVEKNGQKFVILNDENVQEPEIKPTKKPTVKTPKSANNDEFVKYLLAELSEMKTANLNLQADKERLFKEKEQMLIERKNEISQIYKERDEKLMQFLNAMQKPFLTHKNDEPAIEAQIDEDGEKKWISLGEYLRSLTPQPKNIKKVQNKIIKRINHSKFIKFKNGVILIRKNKTLQEVTE